MYYAKASALVAVLAGMAVAAPIEERGTHSFVVHQVSTGKKVKAAPAIVLLNTYAKFAKAGAVAPQHVLAAAAAQQSGSVTANPEQYDEVRLDRMNSR